MRRVRLLFFGILFLILGLIGLALPVIPQVPFLVVSVLCFSACSKRFKHWLHGTWVYRKYIHSLMNHDGRLARRLKKIVETDLTEEETDTDALKILLLRITAVAVICISAVLNILYYLL